MTHAIYPVGGYARETEEEEDDNSEEGKVEEDGEEDGGGGGKATKTSMSHGQSRWGWPSGRDSA